MLTIHLPRTRSYGVQVAEGVRYAVISFQYQALQFMHRVLTIHPPHTGCRGREIRRDFVSKPDHLRLLVGMLGQPSNNQHDRAVQEKVLALMATCAVEDR